jgi:DNA primase
VRYPQTFIDDLRRQADIVRVVGDYVTLKKKGANWMACCPFHQEKTPSFSVNPSKNIFYCFGCSKGGSVFNFVMEVEGLSFPEAVKVVAEKAGVPLPELVDDKRFETKRKEADEVVQLNAWASEFWEQQLKENNAEARAAREYVEGRGLTDETVKTFRLGYAPNSWEALGNYLKSKGAGIGQIERSGLVVKKEQGGYYDRFRGRLIFPVTDAQGRPVAFGARAMRPGDEPKYLNSPETAAYTKGRHLFGLGVTREEIRRKKFAILVEGYLDLIVPFQHGVRNVVASLGTALTAEQAKLLNRFARKVVVNYDGDRAGINAAKRAIEVLLPEDFEVKVLVLPEGADPDEFVRARGADEYNQRRGQSIPYIHFLLEQAIQNRNLQNPPEKGEAVKEVLPFIKTIRDKIQKREYFDVVTSALHVENKELLKELWREVNSRDNNPTINIQKRVAQAESAPVTKVEERLLELLIQDAELRHILVPRIDVEDFELLASAGIFHALKKLEEDGTEVNFDSLNREITGDVIAENMLPLLLMTEPERAEGEAIDNLLAEAEGCLLKLKDARVDRWLKQLGLEIRAAEQAGDVELAGRLMKERTEVLRQRSSFTWVSRY